MSREDEHERTLAEVYNAFNTRSVESLLAMTDPAVDWQNVREGGRLIGQDAVREYWSRQWQEISPSVEIRGFTHDTAANATTVEVFQVVRDADGVVQSEDTVWHRYGFKSGFIVRMDVVER